MQLVAHLATENISPPPPCYLVCWRPIKQLLSQNLCTHSPCLEIATHLVPSFLPEINSRIPSSGRLAVSSLSCPTSTFPSLFRSSYFLLRKYLCVDFLSPTSTMEAPVRVMTQFLCYHFLCLLSPPVSIC